MHTSKLPKAVSETERGEGNKRGEPSFLLFPQYISKMYYYRTCSESDMVLENSKKSIQPHSSLVKEENAGKAKTIVKIHGQSIAK